MIKGDLKLPNRQVLLEGGYKGIAPKNGGLLCPKISRKDIGRVFKKKHLIGHIISPFTFDILDELKMPYNETIILAVKDAQPFTHIDPGASDIGFEVSDWNKKKWIKM